MATPSLTEQQNLATVTSLTASIDAHDRDVAALRLQRQQLLYRINRAGITYERIAELTGIRPSTIATEIGRYREDNGAAPLPRGRRRGISPKRKPIPA